MEIIHKTADDAIDLSIFNKLFRISHIRDAGPIAFLYTPDRRKRYGIRRNRVPILIIQKKSRNYSYFLLDYTIFCCIIITDKLIVTIQQVFVPATFTSREYGC